MMQDIYQVIVRGNFWGGRYYEDSLDSIFVLADDKQDAVNIAKSNIEQVEVHFRNKRYYGGKLAIAKHDKYKFKERNICVAKTSYQKVYNKTLTKHGNFEKVNLNTLGTNE